MRRIAALLAIGLAGARIASAGAPAEGAFRPAASLHRARAFATATTLDDGRVLLVGGFASATDVVAEPELYDPLADAWTCASPMKLGFVTVKRALHTATKLADGRVLIAGGMGVDARWHGYGGEVHGVLGSAHIFDPRTNTFRQVGSMKRSRYGHTATLLSDGRVLITGGHCSEPFVSTVQRKEVEMFDPKHEEFYSPTWGDETIELREGHAAVSFDEGDSVMLVGGWSTWERFFRSDFLLSGTAEVYGGRWYPYANGPYLAGTFRTAGPLQRPRRNAAATRLGADIVVLGGDDGKDAVGEVEVWDHVHGFSVKANLAVPRTHPEAAVVDDYALCIGGFAPGKGETAVVEAFDGRTARTGLALATARNGAAVARLADGRVLVAGGFIGGVKDTRSLDGVPLASCEIYAR